MKKAMHVLIFLLVGNLSTFAIAGETSEGTYYNKFVGVRFPVPADWYLATDIEVMQGLKEGAEAIGLDSPGAKAVIAQMPGNVLLIISEHPLDGDFQGFNRNMGILAINVRGHEDEVSSGADYLRFVSQGIEESQPDAVISEIDTERLGGEEFYRLDVRLPIEGITTHQRQLARIANDYAVVINMAAEGSGGLEELTQQADRLHFSPVSQAVDSSAEGQSFRKQATIELSSSSSNLLEDAGIILMVAGALWFLIVLGRK